MAVLNRGYISLVNQVNKRATLISLKLTSRTDLENNLSYLMTHFKFS